MENGNDNSVITPPSKWLKTIFHCVIDPFASFKVRFSTRPKVFFFSDFNCLLTFTLQVKIYIWRALCRSYNWGSVMQSQPVPAISVSSLRCLIWPRHMYRQGQALTFYKNQTEKLNTTSYVNTHTRHTPSVALNLKVKHSTHKPTSICTQSFPSLQQGVLNPFHTRHEDLQLSNIIIL